MKKYVYFHIFCVNHWEEIVRRIVDRLRASGLYDAVAEIRCAVIGPPDVARHALLRDPKIRILLRSENAALGEAPLLNRLREDSQAEEFHVLYLHTKGVTKPGDGNVQDWFNYMLHFNVQLYRFALQALAHNDCCGVNYQDGHYSGNFWWSKSAYVRDLNPVSIAGGDYVAPEFWLAADGLADNPKRSACRAVSLWTSGVDHYREPYPASRYVDCVGKYDQRFKRLLSRFDHVVVTNYECGLASSRLLPTQPVLRIGGADKVILLCRNIFLRVIGTFIKGCVTPGSNGDGGALLRDVENALGPLVAPRFQARIASGELAEAFGVYVAALQEVSAKNRQTRSQASLLAEYDVGKVDYFVELEQHLAFFRITGCRFPFDGSRKANRAIKESLMLHLRGNAPLQDAIRSIYADDVKFFGDHQIRVDEF